jgi:hypothetical protein
MVKIIADTINAMKETPQKLEDVCSRTLYRILSPYIGLIALMLCFGCRITYACFRCRKNFDFKRILMQPKNTAGIKKLMP